MQKYRTSKTTYKYGWACVGLSAVGLLIFTYVALRLLKECTGITDVFLVAIYTLLLLFSGFLLVYTLRAFFVNYAFGKYSFDGKGITFYTWTRTLHYDWKEVADMGFVRHLGEFVAGMPSTYSFCYFIYISRVKLSKSERDNMFTAKTILKADDRLVLVQFRPDVFEELLTLIPKEYKYKLLSERSGIKFNRVEKRLNS